MEFLVYQTTVLSTMLLGGVVAAAFADDALQAVQTTDTARGGNSQTGRMNTHVEYMLFDATVLQLAQMKQWTRWIWQEASCKRAVE
eukprot:5601532-Amphidinium_carterae.1